MNEKISNTINMLKKNITLEKIKKATDAFTVKQKAIGGTFCVLALAAALSVAPMAAVNTPPEAYIAGEAVTREIQMQEGTAETQWLISIDGNMVLAVNSEEDAYSVFEGLKSYYVNENAEVKNVTFGQEIKFEEYDYRAVGGEPAWVMSVDDAIAYIVQGTAEPKTYVVQGGDTLWDIAVVNGITPEELEQMNPGVNSSNLKIGTELNLYESKPFVTITTTETLTATEAIPYETVYENTNSLYRGQSEVKTAGVSGSREITSEIVKQNGVVVASTVISENILSEPQNQVSLKGTAAIPVYTGSSNGILSAPMSHIEVSSAYGASRGSRRHLGVDLRNPKGTPFVAAADGVVICASYSGSYGNVIKVDHGGGLQTYYSHCDSMYVSVGETVSRGQTIGTVGKTGNATGNVLHFEVRVNGAAQNPMNYI